MRYEKRTDLAIEVKESFPKDHVEIPGVSLQENYDKLKKDQSNFGSDHESYWSKADEKADWNLYYD